jgi:formylglycine-generating enzyme required for sulfatase activity
VPVHGTAVPSVFAAGRGGAVAARADRPATSTPSRDASRSRSSAGGSAAAPTGLHESYRLGYRLRYRPAARQPEAIDTSTSHIRFRCIRREAMPPGPRSRRRSASQR